MSGALVGTQTSESTFEIAVTPDHGVPVVLYVVPHITPAGRRFAVKRDPAPHNTGYITRHTTFEQGVKAATGRAKRYLASYARTAKRRAAA